jgi:hypothetical protein
MARPLPLPRHPIPVVIHQSPRSSRPLLSLSSAKKSRGLSYALLPTKWAPLRHRLEHLMRTSPEVAPVVLEAVDALVRTFRRGSLTPHVARALPRVADLLQQAALAGPQRMGEVSALLRDIIADPTKGH